MGPPSPKPGRPRLSNALEGHRRPSNDRISPLRSTGRRVRSIPHASQRRVTNLPREWYEDASPGVRRLHPPGIGFEWIDIILKQSSPQEARALLAGMGFSPEIIGAALDPHGESVRYRHLGSSLLRLEIPA